ncbi:MAG: DoxX family protein [Cyclobacteriaceae bacterium]|nr:DoxX family membrane protein [Cyclobacteriaceae bacterium]MCH8514882.1 DoxX family protein [Cyclobacteriaceae bacterium]
MTTDLIIMAVIYIAAGLNHFIMPKVYIPIIPPYIPKPKLMNALAGLAEVLLGLGLLFESTRSISALGIILLLIAVFPSNLYMYQKHIPRKAPRIFLALRLPLQLLLIYWAYLYI